MTSDFITSLRAEAHRLRFERDQTNRKLEKIEHLLALYSEGPEIPEEGRAPKQARSGTIGSAVLDAAERYLRSLGERAQTPQIAEALQKEGLLTGSTNPIAAVSSYLSSARDRFDNVRGAGYGLVAWSRQSAPPRPSELPSASENIAEEGNAIFREITADDQAADPLMESAAD